MGELRLKTEARTSQNKKKYAVFFCGLNIHFQNEPHQLIEYVIATGTIYLLIVAL